MIRWLGGFFGGLFFRNLHQFGEDEPIFSRVFWMKWGTNHLESKIKSIERKSLTSEPKNMS